MAQRVYDGGGRGGRGWQAIVLVSLSVSEVCSSWSEGGLQPIAFSVEQMTCCNLPLSLAVAAADGDGRGEDEIQ